MTLDRESVEVLVVAGSNVDKERSLPEAITRLRRSPRVTVRSVSETFESGSVGGPLNAPDFHNSAIQIVTNLDPTQLRAELRGIERAMGRTRSDEPDAPRIIDLDIIYYGDLVQDFGRWAIPDPDALRYRYIAVPVAQIAPDWLHPVTGQSALSISNELTSTRADPPL